MFIGHYKSVSTKSEFYSSKREELDFPMQALYNNERYLLVRSIQVSSNAQYSRIIESAKGYGIPYDIKVD